MKTLVLVLASRVPPYAALIRTIKRTWASVPVPDVETLFYYSGERLALDGDDLTLPAPGGFHDLGRRTLACFEYVLAHRTFDVVFRTNASSYVDATNLREYARAHACRKFYAGYIGTRDISFASGAGYFLSRDLVELALEQSSSWDHQRVEDQALALLLAQNGIRPQRAPRQEFRTAPAISEVDTSLHHFRCRTTSWRRLEDRRIMLRIHQVFGARRGIPTVAEPATIRAWGTAFDIARFARRLAATSFR